MTVPLYGSRLAFVAKTASRCVSLCSYKVLRLLALDLHNFMLQGDLTTVVAEQKFHGFSVREI